MRRVIAGALALLLVSCSTGPDQHRVVESIGNLAIIPILDSAVVGFEDLDQSVDALCDNPGDVELTRAREAWAAAKSAWEPAQPNTFFDPGNMARTVSMVDYSPVSPEGIEDLLDSDAVIDTNYVSRNIASTRRGLGAVEYLLYGDRDVDDRSCVLLEGSTTAALNSVRELRDSWTDIYDGLDPFVDQFTEDMTTREALGDVVGAVVETFKRQTLFEVGKALGISSPEPVPDSFEEGAAGLGAATYTAQLVGIETWLVAGGEDSLIELIRSRSSSVATSIEEELGAAIDELESYESPMVELATEDATRMEPLYGHLNNLWTLFETDVVSLLDVSLGFSDSDGDSG